jgi:drug/metabolite transporter (DMT)-like permease
MTRIENNILLFSITLCWASSYIFIKSLPPDLSPFAYLTLTTGIAAVILVVIFWKKLRDVTWRTVKRSAILSVLLTVNLLVERQGISLLPASNASFLSALTILVVPCMLLLLRRKPTANNMVGAFIIVTGLCLTNRFAFFAFANMGTFYMFMGCISSGIYIISADRFAKRENPLLIGVVQMVITAFTGFALWTFETPTTFLSVDYTRELLSSIFILAFFTKAYAYVVLMFSQKYADPMSVTIIASTEPVVTLTLAVLIPAAYGAGEAFSVFSLFGALTITFGAVVAGSGFLRIRKKSMERARSNTT